MKRKILGIVLFVFLTLQSGSLLHSTTAAYAAEGDMAYKLKVAFLLNFAKFTTWPPGDAQKQTFTLCVLGEDRFGTAFAGIHEKTIGGKPIELIQTRDISQAGKCQLVYIADSEYGRLDQIFQALGHKPILIVSDISRFAEYGGIVEFVPLADRLGFVINQTEATQAGLKINSSLLNLAIKVL